MGQDLRHQNIQIFDCGVLISGEKQNLPITKEYKLKECNDVFSGVGTQPGDEYHIKQKKDYKPVLHPPGSVPVKFKPAYTEELQWLGSEGRIIPLCKHIKWTISIVSVRKENSSLRLSLDPRYLNKNIERNKNYTITVDNIQHTLWKIQMVMSTIWSVSQLRCLPREN